MKPRFAICVDNSEYPVSLELHKIYRVLPDVEAEQDGDIRVIDESGEDYLYPAGHFALVDLPAETECVLMDSLTLVQYLWLIRGLLRTNHRASSVRNHSVAVLKPTRKSASA
jgi:hypothetical protein